MKNEKELIEDKARELRASFEDPHKLYDYLFETLDNFYHRYIETEASKDLKTQELAPKTYGAYALEKDMMMALKKPHPDAKAGIIEMAKTYPKSEAPAVRYGLMAKVDSLEADSGKLKIFAEINWGFPDFSDKSKLIQKTVEFSYNDLSVFRKQLALNLEQAAELFIS
jgi:hypothetical protein